ncbi:MAG: DDE-type integrase/transposase/recombinase [Nitrososphaerales archaeon]
MKLDPVKVEWIIRQKEKGAGNDAIALSMGVSVRRVQELYSSYKKTGIVPELGRPGRRRIEPSEEERRLVAEAHREHKVGAVMLERVIDVIYARHIPHNRIHRVMREMGVAKDEPRKQRRRKWVRYERKYSNSLWHTDWTLIEGMGWLTAYLDDASRFIVGWGLFPEATSEHTIDVLRQAIKEHGKPASILTDRGTQYYKSETDERVSGLTAFEGYLIENEIRHVLGRVSHPQTNGKVERFFRTVKDKLPEFGSLDELMTWYNTKRPHMSLNLDVIETPYQAYLRKMPDKAGVLEDEEAGERYHAQKG